MKFTMKAFPARKCKTTRFNMKLWTLCLATALIGCSNVADKTAVKVPVAPDLNRDKTTDSGSTENVVFSSKVDFLFLVDDSRSMAHHQTELSSNIKLFTAELAKAQNVDYHVGVVTTSMDDLDPSSQCDRAGRYGGGRACGDGRLVRYKTNVPYIDKNTPNGLAILEENLLVGVDGSGEEHTFDPIWAALSPPMENTVNQGFLRPDETLTIVIVTDSEDQSRTMRSPRQLHDFLVALKGGRADKILAYGALVPSNVRTPNCPRDDARYTPVKIEEFIKSFNGTEFNICDVDYGSKLANIAAEVAHKIGHMMYLSRRPIRGTIVVTYGTQIIPNDVDTGWIYDPSRNALLFAEGIVLTAQPAGTKLEVSFTPGTS